MIARLLALGSLVAALVLSPRAAAQTDPAAAEAMFREGRALMAKKQYAEACAKFESSQRLDPGLGTLMNLADCYEQSGRTASAWVRFTEVATEAAKAGDKARERVAKSRASKLEPKLSKLTIVVPPEVEVPGIEIRRGDVVVEKAQWGVAVPVDPGNQQIEVTAPGKRKWSTQIDVTEPGEAESVTVEPLQNAEDEASAGDVKPVSVESTPAAADAGTTGGTRRTIGIILVGVGVVGLGVGTYFGITAKNRWDDAQDRCPDRDRCDAEGAELSRDAKSAADISTIAFIAGAAAVGGGLVLWLGAPSGRAEASSARVGLTPVAPGGPGGSVVGTF